MEVELCAKDDMVEFQQARGLLGITKQRHEQETPKTQEQ